MSRLLKFVVNIFLVASILVAAAILIPPVAGVMTTVVDTPSMDTNLPLGSVTYSTNVDVRTLKPGDEVLKTSDISTYAYILKSCDPDTGNFGAVSAADPNGREETIVLRNTVPRVAVMVPYIGYVMIAMHSLEGIIIIALVVVLMIILFVLSELWKPRDEDEEGTGENDVNAVIAAGLDPYDQSGIDTATIRAAMEDNIAAVNRDTGEMAVPMTRAEKRAAKKARKQNDKRRKAEAEEMMPEAGIPLMLAVDDPEDGAAVPVEAGEDAGQLLPVEDAPVATPADDTRTGEGEAFGFDAGPEQPAPGRQVSDVVAAVEEVMSGVVPEESGSGQSGESSGLIPEEADSGNDEPEDGRFYRVPRLELDEILAEAVDSGENPDVKKDDNTGVTLVDFSDYF